MTVLFAPGGNGLFLLGSEALMSIDDSDTRAVLSRPGVLTDISTAFDSPVKSLDDWVVRIHSLEWISDFEIDRFVGTGPLITDDHPLPEYFLVRSLLDSGEPIPGPDDLRRLTVP
jgi:hypothetical protein